MRRQACKAEANLMQASAQAERFKPLIEAKAISQQEFVNAQAAQKLAEADVAVARAAVQTARINLGYAAITAPISGRIGRALVTEGALVGQGEATPMAVIQQTDPMYVNFTQSASEVMKLRSALDSGQLRRAGSQAASVRVLLEDGTEYAMSGKLLFSDLTVDATSGQITLRAEVPNPTGTLLPGLFVRVRLEQAQVSNAITLPQQAVTRSPQGDSVMVVGADGKVAPRPVKVGAQQTRPMGDPGRSAKRRPGHGRWLPETARRRPGETGPVASAGQRARQAASAPAAVGAASTPTAPTAAPAATTSAASAAR